MLLNLKAEMSRGKVRPDDIQKLIGRSRRCVDDKLSERSSFSLPEAIRIRDAFFPGMSLEYLFTGEGAKDTEEEGEGNEG